MVLTWDQLHLTRRCIQSIRETTDEKYELIIVDNGSEPEARDYAQQAADIAVLNPSNVGFAAGCNQGLDKSSFPRVMFLNNDTTLPRGWTRILHTLDARHDAGIVVPAVTAAGTSITVRDTPHDHIRVLAPFGPVPSAVCYLMRTSIIRALGGWNELYPVASGEDLDLAFTVWTNGLEVVVDESVLVDHEMHGTSAVKLDNRQALWKANRAIFLERWQDSDADIPRLDSCPLERFEWNRRTASSAAYWRQLYERHRDRAIELTAQRDRLRIAHDGTRDHLRRLQQSINPAGTARARQPGRAFHGLIRRIFRAATRLRRVAPKRSSDPPPGSDRTSISRRS